MTDLATPAEIQEEELYGDLLTASGTEGDALLRAEVEHLRTQTAEQAEQLQDMSNRLKKLTKEVRCGHVACTSACIRTAFLSGAASQGMP